MKPDLVGQMPILKKRFLRYVDYAGKPFTEVFTAEMLDGAEVHQMNFLASAVFLNKGGKFTCKPLPADAQLSMINTILCADLDNTGAKKMVLGGNFYGFKPEVGRLDANRGLVYQYTKNGFTYFPSAQTGLNLNGQVRSSVAIKNAAGKNYYMFGINDEPLKAYELR